MPTKVLVVVVVYNGMPLLSECVESIEKSSREESCKVDLFVVDNASSDESKVYLEKNESKIHQLIFLDKNVGFGKGNNLGMKHALENDYDFVFLLNQDAWFTQNSIPILVEKALQNPEYGILSPIQVNTEGTHFDPNHYLHLKEVLPNLENNPHQDFDKIIESNLIELPFTNAAAWLISRQCLSKIGGFDPLFFLYGEDNDLNNRRAFHQFKMGVVTNSIVHHARYKGHTQQKKSFSERKKQLTTRFYSDQIAFFKNINYSFENRKAKSFSHTAKRAVRHLQKNEMAEFWAEWNAYFRILKNLDVIKKQRLVCQKEAPHFLE
ncbi:glycosyltransferase [Bernardetia sp. Wsw4-3y2]|uniref:glycosyltransferase n=1 Tax=Bernardetia sp. Wsw4-3y2 TaxID=3127471 RepID=UPI0030CCC37E